MRYRAKGSNVIRRIFAYIFCFALLASEFNIFTLDPGRKLPHPTKKAVSERGAGHKGIKGIAEFPGSFDEEANGEMINNSNGRFSFGVLPIKYLIIRTELLFIPLILWTVIAVLLQKGYINRMFLIRFIHDSDGEKGSRICLSNLC
ncbi:hypothetical protein [Lacrimispora sp. JR3]|uniref:hypothetical protein n=1 Tax=Lacrimispora sinapis TaxID=3111456 RepID=UPI00374A1F8A